MTKNVTPSGKYYVSILTQVSYETLQKTNAKVGIDLGLKDLVITSDGKKYSSNKFIKHYSKKLAKAQKHLSRKQKGSNSWNRQRIKVARIQEKIHNCRFDKLHKISTDLIRNYDVICCEDLNVKGMQRNHRLAQAISDASWGAFLSMLTYKAVMNEKQVVKIGKFKFSVNQAISAVFSVSVFDFAAVNVVKKSNIVINAFSFRIYPSVFQMCDNIAH